jgi:hypothetical protein
VVPIKNGRRSNSESKSGAAYGAMFGTLDALYLETRRLPFTAISGARKDNLKEEPDVFTLGLFLNDPDYVTLHSILSLAGDLITLDCGVHSLIMPKVVFI